MDAIVRPFGGEHAPKSCVLTSVPESFNTHKEREINKEMKGWRVKKKHTPSSSSDGDDDDEQSNNE